jgi:hypothetical protein
MQALRMNWPICRKGYEILEIRMSAIDWSPYDDDWNVRPPADATEAERRLLARWGMQLGSAGYEEGEICRVIEPRDQSRRVVNVLATAPDLFIEFANINDSEARLLAFVNNYGCLYHSPLHVSSGLASAARFQKVLGQFERDKETGSKRWLSSFNEQRPSAKSLGGCDLKVVPKIDAREIQVWLEPPDLLSAIWLQFLLKAADDMALTHCHSCRNFIAVAGSLGRSDKRFCSPACKQRDYRRREAEKSASRAKGVGAGRIANRRCSK